MRARGDVVTKARARMLRAAALVSRAARELRAAEQALKRLPQCRRPRGRHAEARFTLPFWLHDCVSSVIDEASLEETARWLRTDAHHPTASLRQLVLQARRERGEVAA